MDTSCGLRCILQVLMTACLILYLPVNAYTYYNCSECQSFPSKELGISISDVKRILIDKTNDKVIVGARDCLVKLEPSLSSAKSSYQYAKLSPADVNVKQCLSSGQPKKVCHNYIRLLVFNNSKKIFACGTYARNPRCWRFEPTGPFSPTSQDGVNGYTQSPGYPDQNVTGVVAEQFANKEYIYTGINLNYGTRSSTIYRKSITDPDNDFLKTDDSELFLKDANFVSSYIASDNFIYFFWREKAIEAQNHNIYSRVGRVCTYDAGGAYILTKRFTSFTKARLSCTVPGSVDFSYDHLQSTFKFNKSVSDVYIYGVFTTPETGLTGSAVCRYSLKDIQSLFSTSKYLEEVKLADSKDVTSKAWKSVMPLPNVQDPGRPNCTSSLDTKNYATETTTFAKHHPLLASPVKPNAGTPLFVMPNVRFTQIAVDNVNTGSKNQSIQVVFLATDNGTVYKLAQDLSGGKNAKVVGQIDVFKTSQPILSMKLYKESLYIGSSSGVTKVLTNRCSDFKTCRSCIEQKDPYCGWSNKRCTTKDEAGQSPWVQDLVNGEYVSVCPQEPPLCTIKALSNSSGGDVSLECSGTGIPIPLVTEWQKDSQKITEKNGYKIKTSNSQHSQILVISKFGLEHVGEYQCTVQNNKGSQYTCNLPIKGALPVIFSGFSKSQDKTYFWCKATGIPKPTVSLVKVISGSYRLIDSDTVSVNQDYGNRMYYCIAQNTFGSSKSRNYTINERVISVEIKIKEENWTDSLKDPKSPQYIDMSKRLKKAIQSVYSHDTAFLDITNISYSKGSVNAEISMRFGASPSDKDTDLLVDLQAAIESGKIGSLKVQKTNVMSKYNKGPTQGYRSTGEGIDRGVFAVAILVAIVLSILVGFLMGIKFHRRGTHSCGSRQDSSIHEDKEIQNIKCIKSPTIEETRKYPDTSIPLMDRDSDKDMSNDNDDDHHSTGSSGGRIVYIHRPDRSTKPERNVLVNGKIPQIH
ncbi:semaphorin-2A-like [Actinia tenebrosa]|uniref:Semaphorin-2A-like n=1 Tax=Actinia tenebrosa TaxID=6105 RepID=A0A6P8I2V8_ACTTE|nr:semaphorin-2A-like [Actinia tenebrosa]XP_031559236.1 semaphorin-2A-like [Actinia tenebrosa]XP_031559237.1 semaphorin-2A-like [Actinia tenebrosa]